MNDKILVLSDQSRKIQYKSIIPFYDLDIHTDISDTLLKNFPYQLVIIDCSDISKSINTSNNIRLAFPNAPILLMNDMKNTTFPYYFKKISGYGQLKTFNWRDTYPDELNENIQSILHPEFPSQKSDIALIIPTFNEEARFQNVLDFIDKLRIIIGEVFINSNIYFVNDGSKDNTDRLIHKLISKAAEETDWVTQKSLINTYNLAYNTKKAGTYIEGIKSIDADILVFVDADNSFFIEDIILMINLIKEGYFDIIVATKDFTAEKRSMIRKFLSFSKRLLTKPFLPKGVYDSQTGLKVMSSLAAKYIIPHLHENTGFAIDLEILHIAKKFNFRVLQLPVKCIDREGSHVNIVKDSVAFIKTLFKIIKTSKGIGINHKKQWH
jgi:glycosyltransferase involved in cell wall biosynthesis